MQRDCAGCGGAGDDFRFCRSLGIAPTNHNIVYVGTAGPSNNYTSGAIYKTENSGVTWTKAVEFDHPVVDIDIDPQNSNVIWAATNSFGYGGWAGKLYRSLDAGSSWQVAFDFGAFGGAFLTVAAKPGDPNVAFTGSGFGLIKHWYDEDLGGWNFSQPLPQSSFVEDISFDPQNHSIVYAVWLYPVSWGGDGIGKVGRSTDGGDSWSIYEPNLQFISLAVDPFNPDIIFGGHLNLGVYKSLDYGQSWTPVNDGLSAVTVKDAVVDPNNSSHILIGTISGVYKKTGTGAWSRLLENDTWSVLFHPTDSRTIFAGIEGYLGKSTDGGLNWTFANIPDNWSYNFITGIAIDHSDPDVMFASVDYFGNGGAVHKSVDGGGSFTKVFDGVNENNDFIPMNAVAIDPQNSQHVFAGGGLHHAPGNVGDLWETFDSGDNWTRTSLQDVIVNALLIDPDDSQVMYAGCGYSGGTDSPLYKSNDGGINWIASHTGIPDLKIVIGDMWGTSATDVFAVGSDGNILRYDGSIWSDINSGTTEDLNDIWGSSASNIFAVGTYGTILRYNGSIWTAMNSGTTSDLTGIWGSGPTNVFAVGNSGTILHFDGSAWAALSIVNNEDLNDVWGSSATDVFVVGDNGTVLHYNGSGWSTWGAATTENLRGVWGASAKDVYAVGTAGTIVHYAGTSWIWSLIDSGTTEDLEGIWGGSNNDIFAVGGHGAIRHYDGSSWSAMASNRSEYLTSVWGASANHVFTGGDTGNILHFDGAEWSTIRPGGSAWNAVTDLEFHRSDTKIVYASTLQAGVYISPNQGGRWLNLGTPAYIVEAVSAGSLFAATDGGLLQCTGTGVIAGKVVQAGSQTGINRARIFTDSGVRTISVNGEYMMVCPAGIHTVAVVADGQANEMLENVLVLGADVSWVDVAMQSGVSDPSLNFDGNDHSSSGGGDYCFIGSAAF
jgi:hypothetical protein